MIKTDLHIHSCLSPCADDSMKPYELVKAAKNAGLELIALTDHNSTKNCPAAAAAARALGIGFIPGVEVTTAEDIHCICLFADLGKAAAFSRWLDTKRPGIPNRPAIFNRPGTVRPPVRQLSERELLYMARRITINELHDEARRYGGLFWPAHIDKPSNSLYSVLGCWPEDLKADAAELYYETDHEDIPAEIHRIRCSNAHRLWDLQGSGCELPLEAPDFQSLKNYLQGK